MDKFRKKVINSTDIQKITKYPQGIYNTSPQVRNLYTNVYMRVWNIERKNERTTIKTTRLRELKSLQSNS